MTTQELATQMKRESDNIKNSIRDLEAAVQELQAMDFKAWVDEIIDLKKETL